MDNKGLDLSALLSALSQNPAALSAVGSIMESLRQQQQQKQKPEPSRPDLSSLLGLLGASGEGKTPEGERSATPFGSKEDVQNRIALLNAVKPFLSEQRRERLELIIKLLKLSELGELTKLLERLN